MRKLNDKDKLYIKTYLESLFGVTSKLSAFEIIRNLLVETSLNRELEEYENDLLTISFSFLIKDNVSDNEIKSRLINNVLLILSNYLDNDSEEVNLALLYNEIIKELNE